MADQFVSGPFDRLFAGLRAQSYGAKVLSIVGNESSFDAPASATITWDGTQTGTDETNAQAYIDSFNWNQTYTEKIAVTDYLGEVLGATCVVLDALNRVVTVPSWASDIVSTHDGVVLAGVMGTLPRKPVGQRVVLPEVARSVMAPGMGALIAASSMDQIRALLGPARIQPPAIQAAVAPNPVATSTILSPANVMASILGPARNPPIVPAIPRIIPKRPFGPEIVPAAGASTAGPSAVATGANDAGTGSLLWTNPGRVTVDDGSFADALNVGFSSTTTQYLKGTNPAGGAPGYSVPASTTIDGIEVTLSRKNTGGAAVTDARARIVKGGTIGSTDKSNGSNWSSTAETITYGGATDLWGLSWTNTDVNASDFGFALSATVGAGSIPPPPTGGDASVDWIKIKIYYH